MSISVMAVLNALQPIFAIGGGVVILLALVKPSKRDTYAAKLLSTNSGIALIAAGNLCSLVSSGDLGNRLFYGILVAMWLTVLALPERVRKENPVKPGPTPLANAHVSQNNP